MTLSLVDIRISKAAYNALGLYADKVIKLPPHPALATPVASHPDMLMWLRGSKGVMLKGYRDTAQEAVRELEKAGISLTDTAETPFSVYPRDALVNCASVGDVVIANLKAMSESVKSLAVESGMTLRHTNQGYAKCSTAILGDNAIITADRSIHKVAEENGISSLLISVGGIALDGYDYGFIGGTSVTADDGLLFFGDLASHPDGERIYEFCRQHGKKAVSLTNEPLYDYGTGLLVKTDN